jgi:hypothetical protein
MLTVGERPGQGTVNTFRTPYDFSVRKSMRVSDRIPENLIVPDNAIGRGRSLHQNQGDSDTLIDHVDAERLTAQTKTFSEESCPAAFYKVSLSRLSVGMSRSCVPDVSPRPPLHGSLLRVLAHSGHTGGWRLREVKSIARFTIEALA